MPTLMQRLDSMLSARAHHALDRAEDPLVMLAQVLRDQDVAIRATRRDVVESVAAERQLRHTLDCARGDSVASLTLARRHLEDGDEAAAERAAARHVHAEAVVEELAPEVERAAERSRQLRTAFGELVDQREANVRRRRTLVARHRAASASLRLVRARPPRAAGPTDIEDRLAAVTGRVAEIEALAGAELEVAAWEPAADTRVAEDLSRLRTRHVLADLRRTLADTRTGQEGETHE